MARQDFASALSKPVQTPAPPPAQKPLPPVTQIPTITESVAKVHTLTRKELYLRDDQYDQMWRRAKELQRARTVKGESITANTLIRIAIDHLIQSKGDKLRGNTEEELRKSVGL